MKEKLDRLSEAFVLAEVGDPEGLKDLLLRLDDLLQDVPPGSMRDAASALGRLLEDLILGKASDPARSWQAVEKEIAALQEWAAAGAGAGQAPLSSRVQTAPGDSERAGAPPSASAAVPLFPAEFDAELLGGFILEAREHLDAADVQLLALESDPANLEALHTVFRAFHTIKGAASCLDLGAMQALAHETENLLDLARRGSIPMADRAIDLVFASVDAMKCLTADVETYMKTSAVPPPDPALEALIVRIRETVASNPNGKIAPASPAPSLRGAEEPPLPSEADSASSVHVFSKPEEDRISVKESIRVDANRLDRLVDLIGELVIAESMVSQSGELRVLAAGEILSKSVSQLGKITRELQEMGMSLRMVPVRPLFQKMARLARDLSRKLTKPIEFVTSGEEIEIDKAIVNCMADALVHIIRNALDHGIEESADARLRAGKSGSGRIELRALHREGSIVIEVQDDGRGLDPEAILKKGIEKGIVRRGESLSEQEIFKLIFLPGFSTAKVVTELSGRGVGLDVVKTSVEALRGRIEVQSERGLGTTFRLRLPLTLAIIDGMVIRAGHERYVVPTLSITRLVRPDPGQRCTIMDR